MVKVCIAGAGGRMGGMIIEHIEKSGGAEVAGLLERAGSPAIGRKVLGVEIVSDIGRAASGCGCIIDFTSPEATLEHISKLSLAAVIGTTGLDDEGVKKIEEYSKKHPVVFSPNMSKGVNYLFKLAGQTARALAGYDIEIIEAHHNKKKDAPSGTAERLASIINSSGDMEPVYGRKGMTGERKKNELGIHAVRAGDIVGEHRIIFAGPGEVLEISHRAYSRSCFAAGAVAAAAWLEGKPAGLYGMGDVLGIKTQYTPGGDK